MAPIRGRGFRGYSAMRGRGGQRGGFVTSRTKNAGEESVKQRPTTPESEEYLSDALDLSDFDDEEVLLKQNAYTALLQSLSSRAKDTPEICSEKRKKRRKLGHQVESYRDIVEDNSGNFADNVEVINDLGGEKQYSEPESDFETDSTPLKQYDVTNPADEGDPDGDQDIKDTENDWFQMHFASPDDNDVARRAKKVADNQWTVKNIQGTAGKGTFQAPVIDEKILASERIRNIADLRLKGRLAKNARNAIGFLDDTEQMIVPFIAEYRDLLFGARTLHNAHRMRDITCLHALNHLLSTRDRILKNNAKLALAVEDSDIEHRDQGFTRPKILFLLETKQACVRMVDSMTRLYDFEQQENKKRFLETFSRPEDKFSDDKPADFRELFEGNDDNEFRIGVKITRKTLKFYSTFYNSDIIFASPLGLRRAIESGDKKKVDYDFLSSIEIVVMERADATLMQNWEHALFVFEHLNLQPKAAHGCDFSRVRSWYLNGHATFMRQTIVLSAYLTPKINMLYNKHMRNISGRLKFVPSHTSGLIETLSYGIKQSFFRFQSRSHISDPDDRFKYFNSSILPSICRLPQALEGSLGVLVFIPSYLDFVRVRNSLVDSDFSFASISEYTDETDVRKARSHFMNGKHNFLLYTGRAHHFHRYSIRGVKRVVFYGLPENPIFYEEIVGFIGKTMERGEVNKAEANVKVCFSKWDRLELERVVGTKRVRKLVSDKSDVFDFV